MFSWRKHSLLALATLLVADVAFAVRCEDVFSKSAALTHAQSLQIERSNSIWNRFLWNRYLSKWSDKRSYTKLSFEENLERSYETLLQMRLQQGKAKHPQDFTQRPEEVVRWAEMAIMRKGLIGYLAERPDAGLRDQIRLRLQKLIETRPMKALAWAGSPVLPYKVDKQLPPALLAKILTEGIDKNLPELQRAFHQTGQDKVATYRSFRRVYKHLYMMITIVWMAQHLNEKIEEEAAKTKAELHSSLQELDKGLTEIEALIDSGAFDE